jgi:16S rRNA (uracil1498-N3)-methyltransferase
VPATPAWPPKSLPRLFVRQPLAQWQELEIDGGPAHYLANVLRLNEGAELLVFDGASGEWLARIVLARRGRLKIRVENKTREPETIPDVWLAFAPVKRAQTDWLVEKSTELGAARLVPVMTQRTIAERVRLDRLQSIAIEAAEQCGRTRLPDIVESQPLARFLQSLDRPLYFADEQGGDAMISAFKAPPAAFLIGPEGGFTDEERAVIRSTANAVPISLGPRILRAETAALAALAAYMTLAGDWRL